MNNQVILFLSLLFEKSRPVFRIIFLLVGLVLLWKFLTQEDLCEGNVFIISGLAVGRVLESYEVYARKKRARIARRSLRKFGKTAIYYLKQGWEAIAICLTYRDLDEWGKGSKALSKYMNAVRMYVKRVYGVHFYYCWVREMQKRGVPHYHILLIVPRGVRVPKPDESYWPHGFSNVKLLKFKTWRGIERYLVKYLEKEMERGEEGEFLRYSHVFGVSLLFKTDVWWSYVDFHRYLRKLCAIHFGVKPVVDVVRVSFKWRVAAIQFKGLYFKSYEEMKNYVLDLIYGRVREDEYYERLADSLGW